MPDAPIICWYRQDLRISDHPGLTAAAATGRPVLPVYILDDTRAQGWSPGAASRWWLNHSLLALAKQFERLGSKLILRRGLPVAVLRALVEETGATAVHWTRCYEPDARALDDRIKSEMEQIGVTCKRFAGSLLFEPEQIRTGGGTPYKVFTPFWRSCLAEASVASPLKSPAALKGPARWPQSEKLNDWALLPQRPNWAQSFATCWTPGESGAQVALNAFLESGLADYSSDRDRPDREGTSRLSPHLHFGEISPRQIWAATHHAAAKSGQDKGAGKFLSEIGWREFAHHLLFHWPTLPESPFRPEFAAFPWGDDHAHLRAWQRGMTGYPIVDAGMRQLWQTGWMHNRVRMVVASFLIKHLLISWQKGEAWFWDTLVDASLANNAAGWQWVAGSGADASPYFRIFNPVSQGKKFDPDGAYVREFVPELKDLPANVIHEPWTADPVTLLSSGVRLGETYPHPIVDHAEARFRALEGYSLVKGA